VINLTFNLYHHQQQALDQTKHRNKVAYYLDMGLGKTYVGSEKLKQLGAPYNLVVCQKSKIKDWVEHFQQHYDYQVVIYQHQPLKSIPQHSVMIINYDALWRRPRLLDLKDFTLLLDESQYIKNEATNRTKFILKLRPDNVILLSGTPTGGKYEELWSQLKMLGWGISKKLFYKQYTITEKRDLGGFTITKVKGYKNVDRLKDKLRQHGAVLMKTDAVFDLPAQVEQVVKVANTAEYHNINNNRALRTLVHLRQLASFSNPHKQQTLKDLLASTNERLVIFYNFKKEYQLIKQLVEDLKKPLSYINGAGTDLTNYHGEDNAVTLVQYQAGATGVNLQQAHRAIYYSLPLSAELWMQSKKRIHRLGQNNTCFYYYLITEHSVEEKILAVLNQRRDFTLELFKGKKEEEQHDHND
jgi:SNF2 family DNA or RNA helicase